MYVVTLEGRKTGSLIYSEVKPSEGDAGGSDDRKKMIGRKRLGLLNEFRKEASYAENRKEWRTWKSRICLTAEH